MKAFKKMRGGAGAAAMTAILQNRALLYFLFIVSTLYLVYLVGKQDVKSAAVFIISAFLVSFFHKNMIVILTLAMVITSVYKTIRRWRRQSSEGMKSAAAATAGKKKSKKEDPEDDSDDDDDEEGFDLDDLNLEDDEEKESASKKKKKDKIVIENASFNINEPAAAAKEAITENFDVNAPKKDILKYFEDQSVQINNLQKGILAATPTVA